MFLNDF